MNTINNFSAVAVIGNADNSDEILVEVKDDSHPLRLVQRQICPIGGNWIGTAAASDQLFDPTPIDRAATDDDKTTLANIVDEICRRLTPFAIALNTTETEAIRAADPASTREGFTTLCVYFAALLPAEVWAQLMALQRVFGNLSNESLTVATSLSEMEALGRHCCFGHDFGLAKYGEQFAGYRPNIPSVTGVLSEGVHYDTLRLDANYAEILEYLRVRGISLTKRPPGW